MDVIYSTAALTTAQLGEKDPEKALIQFTEKTLLKDTEHTVHSSEYSYDLTRLSYEMTQALVSSPEIRQQYSDLKALWQASFSPQFNDVIKSLT